MLNLIKSISSVFKDGFLSNKYVKIILKLLITIGLFYYLFTNIRIDEILNQIQNSNQILLISVLLLGIINILLQYYKWKITVNAVLEIYDQRKIISSLLQGFAAAVSTPARVGEYVGRALPFSDKSFLQVTLATLIDKFFSLLIVMIIGALSSILFIHYFYNVIEFITISLLILVALLFYLLFLLLFNENFWDNFLFEKIRKSKRFGKYYNKFEVLKKLDKRYKTKMLLLSFLFYLCITVQYSLLAMSFSHKNEFLNYLWVGNLIMFTKTIIPPFSLGELGIRESASVYFIQRFGGNANVGFNASIFLFMINLILPAIIGLLFQLRKNND